MQQATSQENIQLLSQIVTALSRPQTPTNQEQQQPSYSGLSDYKQPSKSFLQKQDEQQNKEFEKVLEHCITIVKNQNGLQANQNAMFENIKQAKNSSYQSNSMNSQQLCLQWFLIIAILVLIAMQAYHEFYQFRRKHYIDY